MARLVRAATDRNPPTLGGGGCQGYRYKVLAEMLNRITDADEVFLVHRSDTDATPVWWPPMRDLLRSYGIVVHESLDTLLGYKDTQAEVNMG